MGWWGPFIWNLGEWMKDWIPVLGPLGTLGIVIVGFIAYRQRVIADKRAQWWTRVDRAIDAALNDEDPQTREAGIIALTHLSDPKLATKEDKALLLEVAKVIQGEVLEDFGVVEETEDNEWDGGESANAENPKGGNAQ